MDALLRLRVLIWAIVISLWGIMVYQYLGEEERQTAMRPVVNPYQGPWVPDGEPPASPESPETQASAAPVPPPSGPAAPPQPPADPALPNVLPYIGAAGPASSGREGRRAPAVSAGPAAATARRRAKVRHLVSEDRSSALPDPPVPEGFVKTTSRHFNVYAEQSPASDAFLELLESLHANLMLDLAPFSPWARDERVSVFLFKSQDAYRRVTGRPAWSGGASSVPKRKVYVYESEELPGILAHELTHIFFDGFFADSQTDPLWLSEGMATLVQVERGLAAPNWLRENLQRLEAGEGFPIESFVNIRSTSGWPDSRVRLWYAQSYSLVRYLIRTQYRSSFYRFTGHLRDGRSAQESLYRAYGAPYTRLRALEIAWRHEISRASLDRLTAAE